MRSSITLFLLFLIAPVLRAETPVRLTPLDPTADRLVAEALEKTPEIAASRANIEAALRRVTPAGTLPDPTFSFTYQNDGRALSLGDAEGSFIGIMASQPLPWPGKLSLARAAAASQAQELSFGASGRTERAIEARVRSAWYDFVLAHALEHLLDHHFETAKQIEETVRQRYAAGLSIQQDVLRAQIAVARLEEERISQNATITSSIAAIDRLTGRRQDAPIDPHADLPEPASIPDAAQVIPVVMARSPELNAARQSIDSGNLGVQLARKSFLPDFTVSGGSMYRPGFEMGPMWQVGVSVSLPTWIDRRQKNQLEEANARLQAKKADADVVAQQLELRTRERLAQLAATQSIIALYRDRIVPLDELSLESALSGYTAGKAPFLTVLDALDTLYTDRTTLVQKTAVAAKWRVAIDEASLDPTVMNGIAMPSGPGTSSTPTTAETTAGPPATSGMSSMR